VGHFRPASYGHFNPARVVYYVRRFHLERMDNGRTFSLLNVSWKSDCEFELEFVKSNDAFKKELSAPGEVYKYEVIRIEGRSVFVKVFWRNEEFQVELVKLD
jgi:hypothetical protein